MARDGKTPRLLGRKFDQVLKDRKREADEFYSTVIPEHLSSDAQSVMRQSFAGLLWSKQFYHYVIKSWLEGDPELPSPPAERNDGRNHEWMHLYNSDVISMPDKWEYPWYAAWDLAFHCIPLALVDSDFAKEQLVLMLREWYMHPNGQLPSYEWAFGDVNPPVHAWAAWRVYKTDKKRRGVGDWSWVEPSVWTPRMLTALDEGVKGGKWFSLIDSAGCLSGLFSPDMSGHCRRCCFPQSVSHKSTFLSSFAPSPLRDFVATMSALTPARPALRLLTGSVNAVASNEQSPKLKRTGCWTLYFQKISFSS